MTTRGGASRWPAVLGIVGFVIASASCATGEKRECAGSAKAGAGEWVSIFNGKDLEGWTPKIAGRELGDNFKNTFRVENGVLKVAYDGYDGFSGEFGHIFYKDRFSNYRIRFEYRFTGGQVKGGPGWAFRNSGIMVHCQDPKSMRKDQSFPVCIEVQLLGGDGTNERSTGNLCTPGTNVVMDGKLETRHCINSSSKTYHGDGWVAAEVEVNGSGIIRHLINGEVVMEYEKPQLDPNDGDGAALIRGGDKTLHGGWISLQAESHPVEFRKIEVMVLEE